jgi:predicted house-cleaning noncanonical NTP pyrophosphatase (MazG superfamily)
MSQKIEGEMDEHLRKFNEAALALLKNMRYLAEKNRAAHLIYSKDNSGTFYFQKSAPSSIPSAGCDVVLEAFHVDRAIEEKAVSALEVHGKNSDGALVAFNLENLTTQREFLEILKKELQESIAKIKTSAGGQALARLESVIQELDEASKDWHQKVENKPKKKGWFS